MNKVIITLLLLPFINCIYSSNSSDEFNDNLEISSETTESLRLTKLTTYKYLQLDSNQRIENILFTDEDLSSIARFKSFFKELWRELDQLTGRDKNIIFRELYDYCYRHEREKEHRMGCWLTTLLAAHKGEEDSAAIVYSVVYGRDLNIRPIKEFDISSIDSLYKIINIASMK